MDELFLTGNEKHIMQSKKKLAEEFEMKDLGLMHYFLGLEVWQSLEGIFLNQGKYAVEILRDSICWNAKPWPRPWTPT